MTVSKYLTVPVRLNLQLNVAQLELYIYDLSLNVVCIASGRACGVNSRSFWHSELHHRLVAFDIELLKRRQPPAARGCRGTMFKDGGSEELDHKNKQGKWTPYMYINSKACVLSTVDANEARDCPEPTKWSQTARRCG